MAPMAQHRNKQFAHNGTKLWVVFVQAKPETQRLAIQDPELRLPTYSEAKDLEKTIGPFRAYTAQNWREPREASTVAVIRCSRATLIFEWADVSSIPVERVFEISKRPINAIVEVILIRR